MKAHLPGYKLARLLTAALCWLMLSVHCPSSFASLPAVLHFLSSESLNERTYHAAWRIVKDNYHRGDLLVDWISWEHRFDGRLQTRAQLRAAIGAMLSSLNDEYTYLLSEADSQERMREHHRRQVVRVSQFGDTACLKVKTFATGSVVPEFRQALKRLSTAKALVLDLRGNHGGYIKLANDLFAMLTDRGTFLLYAGRHNGARDDEVMTLSPTEWQFWENGKLSHHKRQDNLSLGRPLVVLVDEDTRSAAELLAGALRDNGRATIVGTKTFGKGVLQDSYRLSDDLEFKLVTAAYFLPTGISVHNRGLDPDLPIARTQPSADGEDAQLRAALSVAAAAVNPRPAAQHQSALPPSEPELSPSAVDKQPKRPVGV